MLYFIFLESLTKAINNIERTNNKQERELYNTIIETLLSFYANMYKEQEKLDLLHLIYERANDKEFITNIDSNSHYKYNKRTLKIVSHLLEINL